MERTPGRVLKMYQEMCRFQHMEVKDIVYELRPGLFAEAPLYNQEVNVVDIRFNSLCEHHLLPFYGTVDVSYLPKGKILGLSKFARAVEMVAGRPQVQERMTDELVKVFSDLFDGRSSVHVSVEAVHTCMVIRGIKSPDAKTITRSSYIA